MEQLAEGFIKLIYKLIRTIIVEILVEVAFYWLGRGFLLCMTLGLYPRGKQLEQHEGRITCAGFVVFCGALFLIGNYI